MNKLQGISKYALLLATIVLPLVGCSTQNARSITYYQFDNPKVETSVRTEFDIPRLEVIPLSMPTYLNSRGVAQRIDQHSMTNANWHLWASSPAEMLDMATLNELEKQLPGWFVVSTEEPWLKTNQQRPDNILRLHFKIERFNGGLNNDAELVGSWTLFDRKNQLVMHQNFSETVLLKNDGYQALTSALQKGWEKITRKVAEEIFSNL